MGIFYVVILFNLTMFCTKISDLRIFNKLPFKLNQLNTFLCLFFFAFSQYTLVEKSAAESHNENSFKTLSQNVGRDSNGVPYRIDSAGNQLSDYIAELEISNKELRSQILGLEENRKIDSKQNSNSGVANGELSYHETKCPALNPVAVTSSVNSDKAELEKILQSQSQLQTQLKFAQEKNISIQSEYSSIKEERKNLELSLNNAFNEIESLKKGSTEREIKGASTLASSLNSIQTELNKCNSTQSIVTSESANKITTLNQENSKLAVQNREISQQLNSVNIQLGEALNLNNESSKIAQVAVKQIEELKYHELQANQNKTELKRATLARDLEKNTFAPNTFHPNISNENPNTTNVRSNANDVPLKMQLISINSLVSERKNLFDNAKLHSKGVMIALQTLLSDSGTSLDSYRIMLNNGENLEEVGNGFAQIERKLTEDINTLKRLNKI